MTTPRRALWLSRLRGIATQLAERVEHTDVGLARVLNPLHAPNVGMAPEKLGQPHGSPLPRGSQD